MLNKMKTLLYLVKFNLMRAILLISAILISLNAFPQKELSFQFATGQPDDEAFQFRATECHSMMLGIDYANSIFPDSRLKYTAGFNLLGRQRMWYSSRWDFYTHIPLGIEFIAGRKFKFLLGGGMYVNTLLGSENLKSIDGYDMERITLGGYGKIGPGYQISDKIIFMILLELNADVTKTSTYIRYSHYPTPPGESYSTDNLLVVSLRFKL